MDPLWSSVLLAGWGKNFDFDDGKPVWMASQVSLSVRPGWPHYLVCFDGLHM